MKVSFSHNVVIVAVLALAAALFSAPGLLAQDRDRGLTGDPLVDSILQAPGPDFIERRRAPRDERRFRDRDGQTRESAREPWVVPGTQGDWDPREADEWDRREPAPARQVRREPPPPPAQRGDGPLDVVILDSSANGDEADEDNSVSAARDAAPIAREEPLGEDGETTGATDTAAAGEAPYRERPEPARTPGPLAVAAPAASNTPAMPARAPERPKPDPELSRMIGQMLLVGFQGHSPSDANVRRIGEQLGGGEIGGVIFMSRNIESPDQVERLTRYFLQSAEGQPTPFMAVDQEGGYVQRLSRTKGFKTHPSAERLGQRNDPQGAYSAYRNLALELREYGFNLNLGPVVDLNRNPENPVIGRLRRSYGKDPDHVSAFAKAFVVAHNESGVLTAAKHFPGHGSSVTDSHDILVNISESWTEAELRPYRNLIEAKAIDMIMVGHMYHPSFSESADIPTSLSAKAIKSVLRDSLGYEGVVITDDLDMRGVRQNTTFEERIVRAVEAGNDILLITNSNGYEPDLPARVRDVVHKAVEAGRLSIEQIEASHNRVMALKNELSRLQRTATRAGEDRGLADHSSGG